jgi:DNA-directed RNA polymerase specialized sigma24 family protein
MHTDPSSENMQSLFQRLRSRDGEAFGEICRRLWDELLVTARYRVRRQPELGPVYDEEDALASTLSLMWIQFMEGRTVPPDGVDEFLRFARTIIGRRIAAKARELRAAKRSPSANEDSHGGSGFQGHDAPDDLDRWPAGLSNSDCEIVSKDLHRWLLSLLGRELGEIVEYRIDGKTIDQIAKRMGKPRRTIERMFHEVRLIWLSAQRDL